MFRKAALYAALALTCLAAPVAQSYASTTPSGSGSSSSTNVTGTDPEPINPGNSTVEMILAILQLA
jgi:hypothetical protein